MFQASLQTIEDGQVCRYTLSGSEGPLSYADVIELWKTDPGFCRYLSELLRASSFTAYRWETPAASTHSLDHRFEFVLVNHPEFSTRATDRAAFSEHFASDTNRTGVVTFANLGGDATLVVPTPQGGDHAYGHLAAFVRNAPEPQVESLWRMVGQAMTQRLGAKPIWLSTAGDGVAWLHVRIDVRPKYYAYRPYKSIV